MTEALSRARKKQKSPIDEAKDKAYEKQVLGEIINQLKGQGVDLYGKTLVDMGDLTLRVNMPRKGRGPATNVDIKYNEGMDMYDVTVHKIDKDMNVKSEKFNGMYFDQLPQFFE